MSTMKFTNPEHWQRIDQHLVTAYGERFAFAFTRTLVDRGDGGVGPVLEVVDVALISDEDTEHDATGWYISDKALDGVHNQAVLTGTGLAEFHNHRHGPPRFSFTDERGLQPTAMYVLDLLPGRPYVTAVWAEGQVHAEWWATAGGAAKIDECRREVLDTVTVFGDKLRVLNAVVSDDASSSRFSRQLPLVSLPGQAAIAALRIAVVGAGGTGSQLLLQLAYLGFRDVLVLDDDLVEVTNMNRLVTAGAHHVGVAKTTVAARSLHAIDPDIRVVEMPGITVAGPHPELCDVDLIVGCVDHDGPRQRLNQIAVDTRTPYLDIATGVDSSTSLAVVGGRVALVLPGGPCLQCLGELDHGEIARWAKAAEQQRLDRLHGYGTGIANPSVVHLNALTVSVGVAELIAWISGARPPAPWIDIDITGGRTLPGTQVAPRGLRGRSSSCLACGNQSGGTANAAS